MCDPVSLMAATVGMTAVQQGMSYFAGTQAADETTRYNKQLEGAALNSYGSEVGQGQTQLVYQGVKQAHTTAEADMQARAGAATSTNAAGDAGIGGNTVAALAREYYNRAGRVSGDAITQRDAADAQIEQQITGAGYQYQDRLNQRKVVTEPGLLGPALAIASTGLNATAKYSPETFGLPPNKVTNG